jgi:hypothetical protein
VRIQSAIASGTYAGEAKVTGDTFAVSSLTFTCEFEGYLYATISVATELPFALHSPEGSGEIVVDLATGG